MNERHTRIIGSERHIWYTQNLWTKASGLPVFEVEIDTIPEVDIDCWFESREPTLREIAKHSKRIFAADLAHPVILNEHGALMDGGHRICKALSLGKTTISAVQFVTTPEPDERVPLDA